MKWFVGCSGFSYPGWKLKFYPEGLPQRKWFEYYTEHFNTLELNVTFYRFPQLKTLQGWNERSPKNFKFSVKAPRLITHFKQFKGINDSLIKFYETVNEGLGSKLGCVLFQLPASFEYSEERLELIISALDPAYKNAIEFRNVSWWRNDVFKILAKNKITFCSVSFPKLPDEVVANSKIEYYRFHGVPRLYFSEYKEEELDRVEDQIKESKVKEAYIYFNNTANLGALRNAKYILEKLKSKTKNYIEKPR